MLSGGGANGKKLNADSGAPMNMRQVELTGFVSFHGFYQLNFNERNGL